jgi:hypothetical protein
MKIARFFNFGFLVILLLSCKKVPSYGISDGMKEYFSYKQGSYWIYKNDSTGTIDSAYVKSYQDDYQDNKDYDKIVSKAEVLLIYFKSVFLRSFYIAHLNCWGSDILQVGSCRTPQDTTSLGIGGIIYYPSALKNTKFTPDCTNDYIFLFKVLPSDTVNGKVYSNVLFTEIQSVDSSSTNKLYYFREIHFVKNLGIIKYFQIDRYDNIRSSYSLLRNKSIQ